MQSNIFNLDIVDLVILLQYRRRPNQHTSRQEHTSVNTCKHTYTHMHAHTTIHAYHNLNCIDTYLIMQFFHKFNI